MAQVEDMIVDGIVSLLDTALKVGLTESDPLWPHVLRGGLLQENPLANKVSVTVHIGDPEDTTDAWVAGTAHMNDPYIPNVPMYEIGGTVSGIMWWRRGVVLADLFFIKDRLTQEEAREGASLIKSKIEQALMERSELLTGIVDEFGERVLNFIPVKSRSREGGGPNQRIWRVKVWWQALTAR